MKKVSQFTKMKVAYALIFIIPIVSLWVFYTFFFMPQYEQNLISNCNISVNNAVKLLDNQFNSINTLMVEMQNDKVISSFKFLSEKDVLKEMEVKNRLQSYSVVNGMFDEIILYFANGTIISSKSTYSDDTLIASFPELQFREKSDMMNNLNKPIWCVKSENLQLNSKKLATGLYPVPIVLGQKYAVAILSVDINRFFNSVFSLFPYDDAIANIINEQNEVIMSNNENGVLFPQPEIISNDSELLKDANGNKYLVFNRYIGSSGGLRLQISISNNAIMAEVNSIHKVAILVISLVVVSCLTLMLTFLLAYRKSINKLRSTINYVSRNITSSNDDLLNASEVILNLGKTTNELEEHLSDSQNLIKELKQYKLEIKEKLEIENEKPTISSSWNYILNNYSDYNLTVTTLADMLNMSDATFTQKFKAKYEMTPNEFITKVRIDKVKELLISTNLPINVIIEQIGYTDVSSFIRKFKKVTGVTPGKYRSDFDR